MVGITLPTHPRGTQEWREYMNIMGTNIINFAKSLEKEEENEELVQILIKSWIYIKTIQKRECLENKHLGLTKMVEWDKANTRYSQKVLSFLPAKYHQAFLIAEEKLNELEDEDM